jgi:hypothetical protein
MIQSINGYRDTLTVIRGRDKQEKLMPTQSAGYYLADGTRVPSVTTIIGRFKESGALIHWAWSIGRAGKDYREERDKAADAGTMAHAAVAAWAHRQPFVWEGDDPEVIRNAQMAFAAFEEWAQQTRLRITRELYEIDRELRARTKLIQKRVSSAPPGSPRALVRSKARGCERVRGQLRRWRFHCFGHACTLLAAP